VFPMRYELNIRGPCGGGFEYLHRDPASPYDTTGREPGASDYNRATLFLEDSHTGTWS
jgi:hypothetical protein